jgi:hypothetical protein
MEQCVKAIHLLRNADVSEQPNKQRYVDIQEVCCSTIHLSTQYEYDLGVETFCSRLYCAFINGSQL